MKVKEDSGKVGLKLNIQKTKTMASSAITSWQWMGKQWKQWLTLFWGALKSLQMVTLAPWCEELTHWKRPWCWERLKAGGEGDNRGWDGWMASLTQWTWVWVKSGSWWQIGKPWPTAIQGVANSRTQLSEWTALKYITQNLTGEEVFLFVKPMLILHK